MCLKHTINTEFDKTYEINSDMPIANWIEHQVKDDTPPGYWLPLSP